MESAGFLRPTGVWLKWDGPAEWRAGGDRELGFQVDRGRFDQLLLVAHNPNSVFFYSFIQARALAY